MTTRRHENHWMRVSETLVMRTCKITIGQRHDRPHCFYFIVFVGISVDKIHEIKAKKDKAKHEMTMTCDFVYFFFYFFFWSVGGQ